MSRKRRKWKRRTIKKPLPARVILDPRRRRYSYKVGKEYQPIGPNGEIFQEVQSQEEVERFAEQKALERGRYCQRKRRRPGGCIPYHT